MALRKNGSSVAEGQGYSTIVDAFHLGEGRLMPPIRESDRRRRKQARRPWRERPAAVKSHGEKCDGVTNTPAACLDGGRPSGGVLTGRDEGRWDDDENLVIQESCRD